MKKVLLAFAFTFIMLTAVNAQTFTVDPSNTVSGTVYENDYLNLQVNFLNVSSGDIYFEWETVNNGLDTAWQVTLCDYPNCFNYVPATGAMDPIAPQSMGLLKLTINPFSSLGTGVLEIDVWDAANPNDKERITFNVDAVVSIEDQMLEGSVTVFPNPAQDRIFLAHDFGTLEAGSVTLLDLSGAEIMTEAVGGTANHQLDISTLPAGMYLLRYETATAAMTEKVLKTR